MTDPKPYQCPTCEGAGVMPVLPIPRDPAAFEDRPCWVCGGPGYLTLVQASDLIDQVIEYPDNYTDEQATRIKDLAVAVIFGVRAQPL